MSRKEIGIGYGCLCGTIEEQLNKQGFTLGKEREFIDELHKAYLMLMFHLLTDSQKDSILKKLHKKVMSKIKPFVAEVQSENNVNS